MLKLDDERKKMLVKVETPRKERNEIATKMKGGKSAKELIERGKEIKTELSEKETTLASVEEKLTEMLKQVPNVIFDDVPLGGEECSVEIKKWAEHHKTGVDHLDYAVSRDWVDFERGAKVAGAKFYYRIILSSDASGRRIRICRR